MMMTKMLVILTQILCNQKEVKPMPLGNRLKELRLSLIHIFESKPGHGTRATVTFTTSQ